jgi:hypothetical protein
MGKLTFGGAAFQISALALLFGGGTGLPLLLGFLTLQGAAAGAAGAGMWRLLPRRFRTPFGGATAIWQRSASSCRRVACWCAWAACCSRNCSRAVERRHCIGGAARVRHPPDPARDPRRGRAARAQLGNTRAPLPERMTALVAMQSMPTRTASPVLRELLADSTDDIRLLAYGMLDGAEKQLTQKILAELPRLESADSRRRAGDQQAAGRPVLGTDLPEPGAGRCVPLHGQPGGALRQRRAGDRRQSPRWYMRGRLALTRNAPAEARDSWLVPKRWASRVIACCRCWPRPPTWNATMPPCAA